MKTLKESWMYAVTSVWLPNTMMVLALAWLIASDQGWLSSVPRENSARLRNIEQRLEKAEQIQKERQAVIDEFHRLQQEKK